MDFASIALKNYPYWLLGAYMLFATWAAGYGKLIRVEKKAVQKFVLFLLCMTAIRFALLDVLMKFDYIKKGVEGVNTIPVLATTTVFWEDACHGLPLFLLAMCFRNWTVLRAIWYMVCCLTMFSFGSGHVYQGTFAALVLMLYIPYSIVMGRKYGFGTVMVCHTLYDLCTILTIKGLTGNL